MLYATIEPPAPIAVENFDLEYANGTRATLKSLTITTIDG